ncbi:MAG: hypothetical protein AAGB24_14105 [Bacteroidota bacterium]
MSSFAQTSNNLTGSPYSLFGLGVNTNSSIGKNSALGRGGYAFNDDDFINNLNPASYGTEERNSFIFDFGFLAEVSGVNSTDSDENRVAGNFSSLAIASNIDNKSSFGLSVTPFTDVGYSLIGIQSNIEGSFEEFTSNIFGSGALNDLRLSYGRTIAKNFRLGGNISYLFGTIDETEQVAAGLSSLTIEESNRYRGLRFGVGFQYDYKEILQLGVSTNLPTSLSGRRDRVVERTLDFIPSEVESESDIRLDDFELPLELNSGLVLRPWNNLWINIDHSVRLWQQTGQSDNVGDFVDQNVFSLGGEYYVNKNGFKYWEQIQFRAGLYYDTGYLKVNDERINSYGITAGLGIPLGLRSKSMLNISFANTTRGATQGVLVEENINSINVNLTLKDFWFIKRKIN